MKQEIDTNPSHPVAYFFLGLSHLMQGEPDRAVKVYEQLITISPRDTRLSRYYRNLSMAYLHQGKMKPALQFARSATETPQPFPNAWAGLAAVCALSGDVACSQPRHGQVFIHSSRLLHRKDGSRMATCQRCVHHAAH